jgi:hypothetical protein
MIKSRSEWRQGCLSHHSASGFKVATKILNGVHDTMFGSKSVGLGKLLS